MNSYFKVFGIAQDDKTGEPDWGYVKINIDISIEQLAIVMCLDVKNIVKISEEEYEENDND